MNGGDLRLVLGSRDNRIETVIALYLADCRARGLRVATVETYGWALRGATITECLAAAGAVTVPDLTQPLMTGMLVWLRDRGLGPHTVDDYRRIWRSFLRWAEETGHVETAPKLKRGPLPETERRNLTPDEEKRLLEACVQPRDRYLLRFMVGTGLRLAEVVACDIDHLEEIEGRWVIRVGEETAKGRRHRRVPLDTPANQLSRELAVYIDRHRPRHTTSRALWLSSRPQRGAGYERLSRWGLCTIFRRLRQDTGIPVSPHICRHTFATRALGAGVPERSVRHAGGWKDARSLDPYVHGMTQIMLDDWSRRRD